MFGGFLKLLMGKINLKLASIVIELRSLLCYFEWGSYRIVNLFSRY